MTRNDTKYRRIASHYILSPRGLLPGGIATFDSEGTLVEIGSSARPDSLPGVEFHAGILIPGTVNAHTHLELSYLRGAIPPGGGFTAFARGLSAQRGMADEVQRRESAAYWDAKMYAEGVAAAGDISNGDTTFPVKARSGISYHTFLELYGLNAAGTGRLGSLRDEAREAGLAATITPHSTYSLNDDAFRAAVGGSDNSPLSIHFMESPGERELYAGRGEFAEWYAAAGFTTDFTDKYASPAERVIACVPRGRRLMLVHNTFVSRGEAEMLQAHFGDDLTWVLCPRSNVYITGTTPPVQMLREVGGRIAVGTDSLASNTSLSMAEELKTLRGVPLEELLRWATLSGAEALGMEDRLGSFTEGLRPGAALLTGVNWADMTLTPHAALRRIL